MPPGYKGKIENALVGEANFSSRPDIVEEKVVGDLVDGGNFHHAALISLKKIEVELIDG